MPRPRISIPLPRLPTTPSTSLLRRSFASPPSSSSSSSSSSPPSSSSSSSSPSPPSSSQRRSIVDIALIGIGGASLTGYLLYKMNEKKSASNTIKENVEGERSAFTIPVLEQTGATGTKTLTLLSPAETNSRLTENQASFAVSRRGNPVLRYDTNHLASNSPIEDDSCCVILERDSKNKVKGDLVFWGVFDGHSGWQTSRLLSSSLVSYVARELDAVFRSTSPYTDLLPDSQPSSSSSKPSIWSLFGGGSSSSKLPQLELDTHDPILHSAIKNAFLKLDHEVISAPVRLLEKAQKEGKLSQLNPSKSAGGFGIEHSEALNALLPALSGSCALLAFLDTGRNKLHVACTGDSRAVMGVWVPSEEGESKGGRWRVEALSEDQTGRNPKEVERIQSEHPEDEKNTVIARGRVLGGLEPTRAFGDARYKWPPGQQQALAQAIYPGNVRGPPRNYKTPPYVTATPEVVTVDLSTDSSRTRKSIGSFLPVTSGGEQPVATRFVVLATDGLYDRLDNQEIVSLVGAHLSGVRGPQTRSTVLSHSLDSTPLSEEKSFAHVPRQEPTRGEGEVYEFCDGNLATHLTRNALGGAKREQVSVLLSIPAPLSRRYRDDITCTVILLGDPSRDGEGGSGGVYRRDEKFEVPLKSKL
ncbi:type 2C protein phosphatase PTC5 [Sporobolomyces salmoneus]|uniref:type 2C protein phosphatase PTC5 n=1 Tax=Sporobolomyces salmoneus TaxID=183962 RepID=UPI0031768EF1